MADRRDDRDRTLIPSIDVGARWQQAFDAFLETGRLDSGFRRALEDDAGLKQALDDAFRQQVAALGQVGRALARGNDVDVSPREGRALSQSLYRFASAPAEAQAAIIDDARQSLGRAQNDPASAPAAEQALRGLSALAQTVGAE